MEMSLDKFAGGALLEKFNKELEKISENIYDPNTSATAKRSLTISISIKPGEGREIGDADITVKSSLCPPKGAKTRIVFDYDARNKQGHAQELRSGLLGQMNIEEISDKVEKDNEVRNNNVVDLQSKVN